MASRRRCSELVWLAFFWSWERGWRLEWADEGRDVLAVMVGVVVDLEEAFEDDNALVRDVGGLVNEVSMAEAFRLPRLGAWRFVEGFEVEAGRGALDDASSLT